MPKWVNYIPKWIVDSLEERGVDPWLALTLFAVIASLPAWGEFRVWHDLPEDRQKLLKAVVFANVLLAVMCAIHLMGGF
jgi:hypothetical protein